MSLMSARKETLYNTYGRIYEVQLPKPDIRERKRGGERERENKLVFYAQSTSAVISERERETDTDFIDIRP